MKGKLAALALCLISVAGCGSFVDEPIYNVGYSYNLETHKYTVRFKESPLSEEEERVIRDESGKAINKRYKRDEAISLAKMDLDVYGAIWTKGPQGEPILKSVVKINKEGEGILL